MNTNLFDTPQLSILPLSMLPSELVLNGINELSKTGIYIIYSKESKKCYIGQTRKSFSHRWNKHKSSLNLGKHGNQHLQSAWNLYGPQNFIFMPIKLIEKCASCEIFSRAEKYYIDLVDKAYLYNIELNPQTREMSVETKLKLSSKLKGRKLSEEHKLQLKENLKQWRDKLNHNPEQKEEYSKKLSEIRKLYAMPEERKLKYQIKFSGVNNPMYGRTHSEETKKKIGEKSKGRIHTEETKKIISLANLGKKRTEEEKRKGGESLKRTLKERGYSDELRKRMSEAQLNSPQEWTKERKEHHSEVCSGARNGFYNKSHTDEVKSLLSIKSSLVAVRNKFLKLSREEKDKLLDKINWDRTELEDLFSRPQKEIKKEYPLLVIEFKKHYNKS